MAGIDLNTEVRALAAVAAGGALGAPARYGVGQLIHTAPLESGGFPWATFWTNVSGSFALGVVLALLLNKPVVSIAYDPKIDALMAAAGLAAYCQPIDDVDLQKLVERFSRLEANRETVKTDLMRQVEEHRRVLDEQYAVMFRMFDTTDVGTAPRVSESHTPPSVPKW